MEDTDVHSGIPLGHKFFAILLAAAVAAAGCAWLIDQSRRSASTAVLAYNPALAQSVDSGIASAKDPAVALADSLLNDQAVANLTKQAHLASSTPAGQIGEFRSDLQLTQPSALRLEVRFQAADSSQSMAVVNAVAHSLAASNPASGATAAPSAPPQSASAPSASPVQPSAPANQGQSTPPAAANAASQPTPPDQALTDHPLSEALDKLGAQLSATDQRVERLAAGGAYDSESRQQSLLRTEVREARRTVGDLRGQYATELADPNISARLNEIQQALDSILSGGRRHGFYAVGVSRRELSAERSELRQAISIVNEETKKVRLAEGAHPAANAQPNAAAASATAPAAAPATAAQSSSASPSPAPAAKQSSPSGIQEQNIGSTPAASHAQQQPSQNPLSIVRLAAPTPRPPLWPAIVAGVVCLVLYLGIAAFAYRRRGSDDLYLEVSSAPQRMITPPDPVRIHESAAAPPEPPDFERGPRQRAAFVFQPAPPEKPAASVEKPAAPAEKPPAPAMSPAAPAEHAAAPVQAGNPAPPVEAAAPLTDDVAEPVASARSAAESVAAPAENAAAQAADSEPERGLHGPPAEPVTDTDPVAERIRKGLTETSLGRSLEGPDQPDADTPPAGRRQQAESGDWLDDWLSPSGKSTSRP